LEPALLFMISPQSRLLFVDAPECSSIGALIVSLRMPRIASALADFLKMNSIQISPQRRRRGNLERFNVDYDQRYIFKTVEE
jgi:hypothetical protein